MWLWPFLFSLFAKRCCDTQREDKSLRLPKDYCSLLFGRSTHCCTVNLLKIASRASIAPIFAYNDVSKAWVCSLVEPLQCSAVFEKKNKNCDTHITACTHLLQLWALRMREYDCAISQRIFVCLSALFAITSKITAKPMSLRLKSVCRGPSAFYIAEYRPSSSYSSSFFINFVSTTLIFTLKK